jgi:hypothetical protein
MSKTKSFRTKKSIDGKLISLRERLTHPVKYVAAVSELKCDYPQQMLLHYVKHLSQREHHKNILAGGRPFPMQWEDLKRNKIYRQASIDREFYWTACILSLFSEELINFTSLRIAYQNAIASSNMQEAHRLLDLIESTFGVSLWLLANRINLLQIDKGIEAQKQFYKRLSSIPNISGLVRVLAYAFSNC